MSKLVNVNAKILLEVRVKNGVPSRTYLFRSSRCITLRRQAFHVIYRTVYIIEGAVVRRNVYIRSGDACFVAARECTLDTKEEKRAR